ncbi:MAG: alpha/beta hydrolase [Cyanobacteriota bacterium]
MQFYPLLSPSKRPSLLHRWGLRLLLGFSVALASLGVAYPAHAARRVVLIFDQTRVQVPISVLEIYARTGIATDQLSTFLGVSPEVQTQARRALTHEVEVSDRLFRQALRGRTGEFVLSRLEQILRTEGRSRRSSSQPLRDALIAAYQDDNRISLLEVLKKYPEDEVQVDVRGLQQTYNEVASLVDRFGPFFDLIRGSVQNQICDCDAAAEPSPAVPQAARRLPRLGQ